MRRDVILLAFAVALPAISQLPPTHAVSFKGTLVELKVKSPEKDFPIRNVWVWTPPVPSDQVSKLPVVYMLHGWPGTPNGMIAGTVAPLTTAFAKGAKPFIAVFPDGNALTHADSEWADSYDGAAKIETWLTTDVISTVEAGNIRTRDDRALLGFSMGGYGAGIIGLHHPDLFGQVITLAGYFVVDDLTDAFGGLATHRTKESYQTPSNYLRVAPKIRWFLGDSPEDYTGLIRGAAETWAAKLKTVKAKYTLHPSAGGHSYVFVGNEVTAVASWFKWGEVSPPTPATSPITTPSATPLPTGPLPTPSPTI